MWSVPVCASLLPTRGLSSRRRRSDQRPRMPPPQPQPPPLPRRIPSRSTITNPHSSHSLQLRSRGYATHPHIHTITVSRYTDYRYKTSTKPPGQSLHNSVRQSRKASARESADGQTSVRATQCRCSLEEGKNCCYRAPIVLRERKRNAFNYSLSIRYNTTTINSTSYISMLL